MPNPTYVDLRVTLGADQPVTWTGTATLRYSTPWHMVADYFQMSAPGHGLTQQCYADLFVPDGVLCSFQLGVYLPLGSAVSYTLVQRTIDLQQRAVPPLPWQPPTDPFQTAAGPATMLVAFRA